MTTKANQSQHAALAAAKARWAAAQGTHAAQASPSGRLTPRRQGEALADTPGDDYKVRDLQKLSPKDYEENLLQHEIIYW